MAKPYALYNEINPYCAAWLRNLIQRGLIADGEVAECSLADLTPKFVDSFTQFHTCAGVGIWSIAARRGGWSDSDRLWTASLPCQPFSAAGKGDGFADERHLWPEFFHLVEQCRPEIILGEQVASKDGLTWLDLVQSDLEGTGYAVGSVDSCSAGFGAPHIRQRMYWMANDTLIGRRKEHADVGGFSAGDRTQGDTARPMHGVDTRVVADSHDARLERRSGVPERPAERVAGSSSVDGVVADAAVECSQFVTGGCETGIRREGTAGVGRTPSECRPSPTNGFWHAPDWLYCRDSKWRPVEPGTFLLAHGLPRSMGTGGAELQRLAGVAGLDAKSLARAKEYRIGTLRAYGNAINLEQATEFCKAARAALLT